mmetsp:Transcript_2945/g.9837  ORF Transcript_2945/g.9837 Transcript_2945/m.9837 type:complete len:239 (+) Transcript_2945:3040-3756(+)
MSLPNKAYKVTHVINTKIHPFSIIVFDRCFVRTTPLGRAPRGRGSSVKTIPPSVTSLSVRCETESRPSVTAAAKDALLFAVPRAPDSGAIRAGYIVELCRQDKRKDCHVGGCAAVSKAAEAQDCCSVRRRCSDEAATGAGVYTQSGGRAEVAEPRTTARTPLCLQPYCCCWSPHVFRKHSCFHNSPAYVGSRSGARAGRPCSRCSRSSPPSGRGSPRCPSRSEVLTSWDGSEGGDPPK